ncbi:hypothetical protein [Thiorhodovibrio litoralis]|uniref:hypothetical protein n=1 Tax=Thiorhodovibrio litoralis TaxID=2952932 RepID=UPI002B25CC7A|nr:hypothetical protein [Thiorhodovibrio litoralis]WPL11581.1 hypothetical protein Thiosp_01330 [Thiorhodovibrio litoralis]
MNMRASQFVVFQLVDLLNDFRKATHHGMPRDVNVIDSENDQDTSSEKLADQSFTTTELAALDERLRQLLSSPEFAQAVADSEARDELAETLQAIDQLHRTLIGAVNDQRRSIAEALQQLRHDQHAANAYDRVLRYSL